MHPLMTRHFLRLQSDVVFAISNPRSLEPDSTYMYLAIEQRRMLIGRRRSGLPGSAA
jgi:hypothetical protein